MPRRVMYIRVSTEKQNFELQKNAGIEHGYTEFVEVKAHGDAEYVQERADLLGSFEPGDYIGLYKLDRIGRDLIDVLTTVRELHNRGINIEAFDLGVIDKGVMGTVAVTVLGLCAEMELHKTRERTKDSLRAKRKLGICGGGAGKLSPEQVVKIRHQHVKLCVSYKDLATQYGCAKTTILYYLQRTAHMSDRQILACKRRVIDTADGPRQGVAWWRPDSKGAA